MPRIPQKHDPGGKVRLAISPDVKSSAVWGGPNKCYRYRLRRTWDETKPHAMFIMMNPSTADETVDDRSVAKCERFARTWGVYGGIYVGNTFAYCATNKKHLRDIADPTGPENDKHLIEMAKLAGIVIFAYGRPEHRKLQDRGKLLAKILIDKGVEPYILKLSKNGTPCHPLYLPKTLKPRPITLNEVGDWNYERY
jgi:hypothetical protein